MQQQVELYSKGDHKVYWFDVASEDVLTLGRRLVLDLRDDDFRSWTVVRICLGLSDNAELPPKARKGIIFSMLEDDHGAEVKAAFPQIFVI